MIKFLNFDGCSPGTLPTGLSNTTTIPGHTGNYQVGTTGSISSPNSLRDTSGLTGGSALWNGFLSADEAIQFDQVVNLSGAVMNPLIRMNSTAQTGYGAFINWNTPKIDFVSIAAGGVMTTLSSPAIPSYAGGAQVTVKLEVQGANLRFKSWLTGSPEPTSWTATTTDSTYTAAGYCGFSSSGGAADDVYFGPAGSTFSDGFVPPVLSSGTLTTTSAVFNWSAATQSSGSIVYQLMRSPHGANAYAAVAGAVVSPSTDTTVMVSTGYDYQVVASDGINAPVSSNVVSVTIPTPAPASSYTLTGPASGIVGQTTTPFTVTPNGPYTGTITMTPSGSGLSTPVVLTFANSAAPQTFTLLPTSAGTITLASSNSGTLLNPATTTYLVSTTATFYTLSGPAAGVEGQASASFSVKPNGPYTGTITITPAGCGLATPIVLIFAASSMAQTFTITPLSPGTLTLTATNSGSLVNPSVSSFISSTASPYVLGSGQGIAIEFLDSLGNPSNLASVTSSDETQTLTISGIPTGSVFPLTFNGQTTAPIPVMVELPQRYALFTVPVTPGTAYEVAVDYDQFGRNIAAVRVDLIDGISHSVLGNILATNNLDPNAAGATTYSALADGTNSTLFKVIGTVTPSTTSLLILYTQEAAVVDGSLQFRIQVAGVTNVATSAVSYYGVGGSAFSQGTPASGAIRTGVGGDYQQTDYLAQNYLQVFSIGGPASTVAASTIQSALAALSSVRSGGLTVIDAGGANVGPYAMTFGGTMGSAGQPLISSTSSNVSITRANAGGKLLTVQINGGPPQRPSELVWGKGIVQYHSNQLPPYSPVLQAFFPQQAPDVTYQGFGQGLFLEGGYGWTPVTGISHGGNPQASSVTGNSATFYLSGLMSDSYQLAMTWVADSTLANNVGVVVADTSGNTLNTLTINQAVAPSDFADGGVNWHLLGSYSIAYPVTGFVVTITNAGGKVSVDSIRYARTSINTSVQIRPTDSVTMSFPDGLFTTVAGPVAGVSNLPLTNLVNQSSLTPLTQTPRTMGVGYNVFPDILNFNSTVTYSNLATRIDFRSAYQSPSVLNSLGYPALAPSAQIGQIGVAGGTTLYPYGDPLGVDYLPNGYYSLMWDGPDNIELVPLGDSFTIAEITSYRSITGATNNRRVYNIQGNPLQTHSPSIFLEMFSAATPNSDGNYAYTSSNFRIYPPDPTDPTGLTPWGITSTPPKWHPALLSKLQGTKVLRFMDWLGINSCNTGEFADLRVAGSLNVPARPLSVPIASITAVPGTSFWYPGIWTSVQIVTMVPHGLFEPAVIVLTTTETMTFSDGMTISPGKIIQEIRIIDDMTIQMVVANGTRTLTNSLTGGTLSVDRGAAQGIFTDIFDLCNTIGADCHMNIPNGMSDAGVTAMVATAAANLDLGLKLYIEYGNEHWNNAFPATGYFEGVAYEMGGSTGSWGYDFTRGYVARAVPVNALALAAWTAAGRARTDIVLGMGSWAAGTGTTTEIAALLASYSATIDRIWVAPYVENAPAMGVETSFQQFYDLATPAQGLDYFEWTTEWGQLEASYITNHRAALDAAGLTGVKIGCYEGGLENITPGQSSVNALIRSYLMLADPRLFDIQARLLQKLQDAGVTEITIYYLAASGYVVNAGPISNWVPECWSTYYWWNQQPGTGNRTTDAINLTNPLSFNQVKSQAGGAINQWNALVPSPVVVGRSSRESKTPLRAIGTKAKGMKAF